MITFFYILTILVIISRIISYGYYVSAVNHFSQFISTDLNKFYEDIDSDGFQELTNYLQEGVTTAEIAE